MKDQQELCQYCWGSGWETQFITPCTACNGTGKIKPILSAPSEPAETGGAEISFLLDWFKEPYYTDANDHPHTTFAEIAKAIHQFAQSEVERAVVEIDKVALMHEEQKADLILQLSTATARIAELEKKIERLKEIDNNFKVTRT